MPELSLSQIKVLLVEDERALASTILIALRSLGIEGADHVRTIKDARKKFQEKSYDLVLLDRGLPDGDGMDLCRNLRRNKSFRAAILMITAKGSVAEKVEGLEQGADDYLPKPFALEELKARIHALVRRIPAPVVSPPQELWKMEFDRLRILGPKGWVTLTPLEYKLAQHLISAHGGIVSRETLLKEVWGFRFLPKTRTVDYFMGRLRKNFEKNPDEPKHFLTVRGAGYRFEAGPESDPKD